MLSSFSIGSWRRGLDGHWWCATTPTPGGASAFRNSQNDSDLNLSECAKVLKLQERRQPIGKQMTTYSTEQFTSFIGDAQIGEGAAPAARSSTEEDPRREHSENRVGGQPPWV
jgi:hypothetical protein